MKVSSTLVPQGRMPSCGHVSNSMEFKLALAMLVQDLMTYSMAHLMEVGQEPASITLNR